MPRSALELARVWAFHTVDSTGSRSYVVQGLSTRTGSKEMCGFSLRWLTRQATPNRLLVSGARKYCGQRHRGRPYRPSMVFWLALFLLPQSFAAAQVKQVRRVLILNDLGIVSSPGYAEIDQTLFNGLQESRYQIELYQESLELALFPDEASQRRFREHFIQTYSDRRPDLIIAAGSASLKFIDELDEGLLRDTPIIFCTILGEIPEHLKRNMHVTGVFGELRPEETLNAALRLLPDTRHVVVVGGMGPFDANWEAIAKQSFHSYESKLELTYLTDLTMPALLERLRHLPTNTIVYHTA